MGSETNSREACRDSGLSAGKFVSDPIYADPTYDSGSGKFISDPIYAIYGVYTLRLNHSSDSPSAATTSTAAAAANSDVISMLLRSSTSLELRLW